MVRTMDEARVKVEVLSVGALNTGWGGLATARLVNDGLAAAAGIIPTVSGHCLSARRSGQ